MLTFVLAFLLTPWFALAQTATATVTGHLINDATGADLPGVTVHAGSVATITDAAGRFTLVVGAAGGTAVAGVPVRVTITAAGYVETEVVVPISSGTAAVEVRLHRNPSYSEEVVVSGRAADVTAAPPSLILEPLTVNRVAGSGDNVFRVLQTLPGVSATDDFGSRLAVRGGGPDQNLTVMDGVEIHNPYRLFGLTSAFNPETIDRFELTAGGFSAKYGDRLSSILLVDNRAGSTTTAFTGSAALSATDANVVVEGAMPKGSWLVTGRRTYYDVVAERFTDSNLPSFDDLQTKVQWEPMPGRRFTFFALRSREDTDASFDGSTAGDRFALKDAARNEVGAITFASSLGARATTRTTAAWYRYSDALDVDGSFRNDSTRSNAPSDDASFAQSAVVFTRSLGVRDVSVRQEVSIAITPTQTLDIGLDAHALNTEWGWSITGDRNESEANGSSVRGGAGLPGLLNSAADSPRASVFIEDDLQVSSRLRLAGGARLDWNRLGRETIVSPRVRATLDLTPRTKMRMAAGLYTQSPGYEKLLQSDYFVDLSNTASLGLKSERSVHLIGGVEHEFTSAVSGRVEAYHKTFDRAIAGRIETAAETAARVAQYDFPAALSSSVPSAPQITTEPSNDHTGQSYGFDAYLEKRQTSSRDRLSGWVSYTWGKAALDRYGYSYPFDYDRRHSLSVVSTLRVIPRLDLSATLRVASGFPYTAPLGVRVASIPKEGAAEGAPGSLVPRLDSSGLLMWTADYGGVSNLNSGRLPLYARLDLRVAYIRSAASRWQLYVEAINALRRDNAGSLNPTLEYDPTSDRPRVTLTRDGGLPFFPSFGFRIRF